MLRRLTGGVGILAILLFFPGGQLAVDLLQRPRRIARGAAPEKGVPAERVEAAPKARVYSTSSVSTRRLCRLSVVELTVTFGSHLAVDHVAFEVQPGEIVGLIGSNGAGKSTIMNAVGGYVPYSGLVEILGADVAGISAARRDASVWVVRSKVPNCSAISTCARRSRSLETAEHAGVWTIALGLPRARSVERTKLAHADEIIGFLGLGEFAERFVNELSTGTRRIVELGAVSSGPAHGVAPR